MSEVLLNIGSLISGGKVCVVIIFVESLDAPKNAADFDLEQQFFTNHAAFSVPSFNKSLKIVLCQCYAMH